MHPYLPKACGFVVAQPAGAGWTYLLLTSRKWSEPGFPKGHLDAGESELETARRETQEEAGLAGLEPLPGFRVEISYPVERKGLLFDKSAVYFLAKVRSAAYTLSDEHTDAGWHPLLEAMALLPHDSTRNALRDAALYLKDPALFDLEVQTEAQADAYLAALPKAQDRLLGHLRGGARMARRFATALAAAGQPIHVEATAVGTLLHDTGRALGHHADHQLVGLDHLKTTAFSPYAFACISHFTKGAPASDLIAAGLPEATVRTFAERIDADTFTWEEKCAALADACMCGDRAVMPRERFADLRKRYGRAPIVDLQERRTAAIRHELLMATGEDPLALLDAALG